MFVLNLTIKSPWVCELLTVTKVLTVYMLFLIEMKMHVQIQQSLVVHVTDMLAKCPNVEDSQKIMSFCNILSKTDTKFAH